MNILVLTHTSDTGGASRSLTTVMDVLQSEGHNVLIFAPFGRFFDEWSQKFNLIKLWEPPACMWMIGSVYSTGTNRFSFGYMRILLGLPFLVFAVRRSLMRFLNQNRVDCIYVNSLTLFPIGLLLHQIKKKWKLRIVWHIREVLNDRLPSVLKRFIVHSIVSAADRIIAITSNETIAFQGHPVQVIHNNPGKHWEETNAQKRAASPTLNVCMSAGFLVGKGIPDFFHVARIVRARFPNVEFSLYTPRPTQAGRVDCAILAAARYLSSSLNLAFSCLWAVSMATIDGGIHVHFDQKMSPEVYQQYAVYLRTDETGSPWGRDIIEAMALGLVVIATGKSEEFVVDGVTGFLVPPGNPDLMADRIIRLISDPLLLGSMRHATLERARSLFDYNNYVRQLRECFIFPEDKGSINRMADLNDNKAQDVNQ